MPADHRAFLFWGSILGLEVRPSRAFFFSAQTTTVVPRRGGRPCRRTCCAPPAAVRASSLNEMLVNGQLRLAALAVSAALSRACLSRKKKHGGPGQALAPGRKECYPWFDKLAAAQQRPGLLGAAKLGRRRRVCFKHVTVSAEDAVANARRFQCPVSEPEAGSGPNWPGPAWSL